MSEANMYVQHMTDLIKGAGTLYEKPKIDYYTFRDNWLALFNATAHDGLAPLGEWVQGVCRGNPFLSVDVIKDGQTVSDDLFPGRTTVVGGQYMFTVPPILNREIDVKFKNGKQLDNSVVEASEISKRVANAGQRHFRDNVLNNIIIDVPVDPGLSEKMDAIFEHFGVKRTHFNEKNTEQSKSIETKAATNTTSNDDLDYDF